MKSPYSSTHLPILLLLLCALVTGLFTVSDFGQSWDEVPIYRYGNYALDAYRFFLSPESLPDFRTNLNLYGPAYFMIAAGLSRLVHHHSESPHLFCYLPGLHLSLILSLLAMDAQLGCIRDGPVIHHPAASLGTRLH